MNGPCVIKKYAGHYIIIDVKETAIRSIDAHVAEFFDSVLMIPIERFFVAQLAEIRGKSMDERRYMWKVEY